MASTTQPKSATFGIVREVPPKDIAPVHPVKNPMKLVNLFEDMAENGWQGRPLLVAIENGCIQALTGSHRIAAARHAGLETIPAYAIDGKILSGILKDMKVFAINPAACRQALQQYGDEVAIHLFESEDTSYDGYE